MKDLDRLEILHHQQFQCLLNIVEDWIRDWSIWANNPLWTLYIKKKKEHDMILERLLWEINLNN